MTQDISRMTKQDEKRRLEIRKRDAYHNQFLTAGAIKMIQGEAWFYPFNGSNPHRRPHKDLKR